MEKYQKPLQHQITSKLKSSFLNIFINPILRLETIFSKLYKATDQRSA